MKINAVSVVSTDLKRTVQFYTMLGFKFPEFKDQEQHLEPETPDGSARLMIDTKKLITEILGEVPRPANSSGFAIEYDTPAKIDEIARDVENAGFMIVKQPWNAFWGQRYCIVEDPDGYKCDLYAALK